MREYSVASTNVFNMDETGFIMNRECLVWVLESGSFVIVPIGDLAHPPSRLLLRVRSSGELPGVVSGMAPRTTVSFFRDMNGISASWHFSKSDFGWTKSELALESNLTHGLNAITLASAHHRWPPITHKPDIL